MSDPLSITASLIAILGATQALCEFIARVRDAPQFLQDAKGDVKATEIVIEDLLKYTQTAGSTSTNTQYLLSQESALSVVLSHCQNKCQKLQKKLSKCIKHSEKGGIRFRDRLLSALKEKDIVKFREELASDRDIISLRVSILNILSTSENHTILLDFRKNTEIAVRHITSKLNDIQVTISNLENISGAYDKAVGKALQEERASLDRKLRVCDENMCAAKESPKFTQKWEDTNVKTRGQNYQGMEITQQPQNIEQSFGKTTIEERAMNATGGFSGPIWQKFVDGNPAEAGQGQSEETSALRGQGAPLSEKKTNNKTPS